MSGETMSYQPLFDITDDMLNKIVEITEIVTKLTLTQPQNFHLRKENRLRSIHSSLAIEANSLSLEQVTAIVNGKRVLGKPQEIREVQNAYQAYELIFKLNPYQVTDLLQAHGVGGVVGQHYRNNPASSLPEKRRAIEAFDRSLGKVLGEEQDGAQVVRIYS